MKLHFTIRRKQIKAFFFFLSFLKKKEEKKTLKRPSRRHDKKKINSLSPDSKIGHEEFVTVAWFWKKEERKKGKETSTSPMNVTIRSASRQVCACACACVYTSSNPREKYKLNFNNTSRAAIRQFPIFSPWGQIKNLKNNFKLESQVQCMYTFLNTCPHIIPSYFRSPRNRNVNHTSES